MSRLRRRRNRLNTSCPSQVPLRHDQADQVDMCALAALALTGRGYGKALCHSTSKHKPHNMLSKTVTNVSSHSKPQVNSYLLPALYCTCLWLCGRTWFILDLLSPTIEGYSCAISQLVHRGNKFCSNEISGDSGVRFHCAKTNLRILDVQKVKRCTQRDFGK